MSLFLSVRRLAVALAPLALILALGCGPRGPHIVPVKGVAVRGGRPVPDLLLSFYPESGARPSNGRTDAQGRFELSYDKDTKGAIVGKHKVVVGFRPKDAKHEMEIAAGTANFHPDQEAILEKYGKLQTTPLTVEITPSDKEIRLNLD